MSSCEPEEFARLRCHIDDELYKNVLSFWVRHSPDADRGGFYSCLDSAGTVYDTRKFMWLNGRQIWMFSRICASATDEELVHHSNGAYSKTTLLDLATRAADFMLENGIRDDGLVYFSLSQEGLPYHFERKIFSACFLCMGLASLSSHSLPNSDKYRKEALKLLNTIIGLVHDPSPLGRPKCPGAPASSPLNVPMIVLNVLDEFRLAGAIGLADDALDYGAEEEYCVREILKHVIPDRKIVLENVLVDGSLMPGYDGRLMNPGHAIEAGWFLYSYSQRTGRVELKETAVNMIEWSFEAGWDAEHGGGLLYFLDSDGGSSPYLEWSMKLWWPHTEAMIAYAMLFEDTKNSVYWDKFKMIYDYTITHFSDAGGAGEWFGYLDRDGKVTHSFKGGPYKGCFHVPRSLFFVSQLFKRVSFN